MMFRTAAALALLLTAPALAETKGDCGTVIVPKTEDMTAFNPVFAEGLYNEEAGALLFQQLIWINRYYQIDWPRSIASAVTSPDNGTTYNVTLRPWHWSDGLPVTSADVAYTLSLIKQLGQNWPSYGVGNMPYIIKRLTIIDATHFQIILTQPANPQWFIYNGLAALQPLPSHAWAQYTLDQLYQAQSTPSFFTVVDGPLRLQRLDEGQDAIFVPNPHFEGGKMHFSKLVINFLHNDGAMVQGAEAGTLDLALLPDALANIRDQLPGLYYTLHNSDSIGFLEMNFQNTAVDFFRDVRVRQAMQDAINQRGIINAVYHGVGYEDYGPIPPDPPNFLSPAMRTGHYPVGYNPARARALLAEAGFTPGPDGIMQKNGKKLSFVAFPGDDADAELVELVQTYLRAIGIEMRIKQIGFTQKLALMNSQDHNAWQAAVMGSTLSNYPSGEGFFESGANQMGYSDPTMDRLINDSITKPGLEGLYAYEDYAAAQQPFIFLPADPSIFLVRDHLHGIDDFENPAAQYSPDQLYCTGPL